MSFNLPDTVVYRCEQPISWYFTAEGQVKCKQKAKLSPGAIKQAFLREVSASGVVASFMYVQELHGRDQIVIEHFDRDDFGRLPRQASGLRRSQARLSQRSPPEVR
jgi:hypothetical protein